MAKVAYWLRHISDGTYAGEGREEGENVTLVTIQARQPTGIVAIDAETNPRPPNPAAPTDQRKTQAKAKWAAAPLAVKNDAMIAIALMLGIEDPV